MPTLRDNCSRVRSMLKLNSMDILISDRAIAAELRSTALKFIKQQTDRRRLLASPNIFTTLSCIEMEEVPVSSCCSYQSDCMMAKSKEPLPKLAEGIYGVLVQGVYSVDKRVSFKQTSPNRYVNMLQLGMKNADRYFWVGTDKYLYITDPNIELVSIIALFEDDVDFQLYTCDNPPPCPTNPLDLEFKCPGFLESGVVQETYKTLLETFERTKENRQVDDKEE